MRRRIWVYPDGEAVEVAIIGPVNEIGPVFAALLDVASAWHGWRAVRIATAHGTCAVLELVLGRDAVHDDPIAEFLTMCAERGLTALGRAIEWGTPTSIGTVGTW